MVLLTIQKDLFEQVIKETEEHYSHLQERMRYILKALPFVTVDPATEVSYTSISRRDADETSGQVQELFSNLLKNVFKILFLVVCLTICFELLSFIRSQIRISEPSQGVDPNFVGGCAQHRSVLRNKRCLLAYV